VRRAPISAALVVALLVTSPLHAGAVAPTAPCYPPPVEAPVVRWFAAPACEWCPGHRGLDFATPVGLPVLAVAGGVASFVGLVARVRYVVIAQDDGLRATYGQLTSTTVRQGQRVAAGQQVGSAAELLFFAFRDGERYLDPWPMLGTWERRARLVPAGGTPPRPGPPARVICRKAPSTR